MNIILTEQNKIDEVKWNDFVKNHSYGNFFQSPAYYNFYKSLPSFQTIIIACIDDNSNICGILTAVIQKEKGYLKSKFSSRCIIYGGPLVKENNTEIYDLILQALVKKVSNRSIYIEFRNLFDLSNSKEVFKKNGFDFSEHYNFILEIQNLEKNLKLLNKTRRWEINKSIKENTKIFEANDLQEIREFYKILKKLYKVKVKKPLPDFIFFEKFFLTPTLGKYFIIKQDDRIIGGVMCPIFKDTIYELYECALDKEYKQFYPGTLATWAPIEYAAKNDLKYFDFLGAGSADSDYGVREFKSKFGGNLVNYGRFLRINNRFLYNIGKLGLKLFSLIR